MKTAKQFVLNSSEIQHYTTETIDYEVYQLCDRRLENGVDSSSLRDPTNLAYPISQSFGFFSVQVLEIVSCRNAGKGCIHKTQSGRTLPWIMCNRELRAPGYPIFKLGKQDFLDDKQWKWSEFLTEK
jgi:hypothetical protein